MINYVFFICMALAFEPQWWINVPECPLVINQPYENAIMVLNNGEKTVKIFSLGCITYDDQKKIKIGKKIHV